MRKFPYISLIIVLTAIASSHAFAVDVEALIASMTLDEKIGQMTMAERITASPADVQNFYLGSILSGGGSAPASNTPTGWADMHDAYQNAALSTPLGIPILYGIDAVHGHNNVFGATLFPHNIGLGATRDPVLIEEIGRITALEVANTGLEWTFAPCVAVVRDERWGRTYEGFGEDPQLQTLLAGSFVQGLQGMTMNGERVIACAKHFAGDGGTNGGVDRGNAIATEAQLRNIHMPGFIEAIDQGVGTIMPSYSSWNGVKMHQQSYLLTDVLKTEFAFDGFLISDWEAVYELSGPTYYDQVVQMVNAGVDMGMEPFNWQTWISTLKTAVQNNDVSMARIDDAVRRILEIKDAAGVFDEPLADRALVNSGALGSPAHRDVAREAVRKSLVLLKNDGVLPLPNSANVFVAGKSASNMGYQCGGWSISWQGASGNITPGTTILQGIQDAVAAGGGSVTFSANGTGSAGHDVAIVVLGETPYAEGAGDNGTLALDMTDVNCLNNISDIPTVVVLVSGRPMMITDYLDDWNAFVAAWLPGTEGDGVAEVLFGEHDFTGKLPHTWPTHIGQVPINVGDSPYNPLFAYGYGLDYNSATPTVAITSPANGANVPAGNIVIEASASDSDGSVATVEFYQGTTYLGEDATAPYSFTWPSVFDGCYTMSAKAFDDTGLTGMDTIDITVGNGCGGQAPYHGTPLAIPGVIQAEDFDNGGEGLAYQDADVGNNGGQYRTLEDVDIENCFDVGAGYNVGWMVNNEWIEYTVDVAIAGPYLIELRVASQDTGGNFHLEFDGEDKTGHINVPVTGGWQDWVTIESTAQLPAGVQEMRFVNEGIAQEYNINFFNFSLDGCSGVDPAACADTDGDGIRDDNCLWWECMASVCEPTEIVFADMGGGFGSCVVDGTSDANDRFHALNCFANVDTTGPGSTYPCEANSPSAVNVDAGGPFGQCCPDGVCDGNDVFHVLNAFSGNNPCSCPANFACPCPQPTDPPGNPVLCAPGPAPLAPFRIAPVASSSSAVTLRLSKSRARSGDEIVVEVFLDNALPDLRGYQLHLTAGGGSRGRLELVDIVIEDRKDHALAGEPFWRAFNLNSAQMVVGLEGPGMATQQRSYLATFTYRASKNAAGGFTVELLHDTSALQQRTYLFPTEPGERIHITSSSTATITVREE